MSQFVTTRLMIGWFFLLAAFPLRAQETISSQAGKSESMKPKILETRAGAFQCDAPPALLVGRSLTKTAAPTALQNALRTCFGTTLTPTAPGKKLPASPFLLLGTEKDSPELKHLVEAHQASLPPGGLGEEGYLLDATPERVLLVAAKPAGAYYGVRKLLERNTATDKGLTVPAAFVADWPALVWRGLHLLVNGHGDLPELEKLITDYMPQFRLNQLILEINYHYRFQSHPEVTEGDPLTREDCQQLKALADQNFVRLIPMINCLGHQSWAEHTAQLLKTHPEFDETPNLPADNKDIYCRSWCPMHPEVSKFVNDLTDELIDAFQAKAFHVGMDEVFILGECPRCKGQDNAKLFAKAVNDLHTYLVGKRKVQMLMWGDRLLDGKATGYGKWEASENATPPAIDLIPKDIILCDWHYETKYKDAPATYPSVAYFQEKGFHVWPSGWRSVENVQLLTTASLQHKTDRLSGYLATTWTNAKRIVDGLAAAEPAADGVPAAIRKGAQIAWEGL